MICKLAENAGIPFEIVHSHTTADAPETVYHVRKRAKEYELKGVSYTIHYPTYKGEPTSMWKLIPIKLMPPTRVVRYCCAVLKETTGRDRFIATGVRWAESTARKNNRSSLETYMDCWNFVAPLIPVTDDLTMEIYVMVFNALKKAEEQGKGEQHK